MHIPEFIKEQSRAKKLAALPTVGVLAVATIWALGTVGGLFLALALILWLIINLLDELGHRVDEVDELQEYQEENIELQVALTNAESERDALRQEATEPSLSLSEFLHALDDQASRIELVAKHRALA